MALVMSFVRTSFQLDPGRGLWDYLVGKALWLKRCCLSKHHLFCEDGHCPQSVCNLDRAGREHELHVHHRVWCLQFPAAPSQLSQCRQFLPFSLVPVSLCPHCREPRFLSGGKPHSRTWQTFAGLLELAVESASKVNGTCGINFRHFADSTPASSCELLVRLIHCGKIDELHFWAGVWRFCGMSSIRELSSSRNS